MLSIWNLGDVLNHVWPARSRYYIIGMNLGLDHGTLKAIMHDGKDQSGFCLLTMLEHWLTDEDINPPPSWKALADALKVPNVGVDVNTSTTAHALTAEAHRSVS